MERFAGSPQEKENQRKRKRQEVWAEDRECQQEKKRSKREKEEEWKKAGGSSKGSSPGVCQALLPVFPSSEHCSEAGQLAGEGRRGLVLRRVWEEPHGSFPGAPDGAPLPGTGARGLSAHAQLCEGIARGDKAPEPPRSHCRQQLCLLGCRQLRVRCVPRDRGTKPWLLLPLCVDPCFLTMSLQVPISCSWRSPCDCQAPALGVHSKRMFSLS